MFLPKYIAALSLCRWNFDIKKMSRAQLGHSSNLVLFYLPLWNKAYYDSLKKVKEKVSPFTPRLGHFDNLSPPPPSPVDS